MEGEAPKKSRRLLTAAAIILTAVSAAYLWIINVSMLRESDRRRLDELQLELMTTRDALSRSAGDFGFLTGASVSLLKSNDKTKRAGGVVLHRGTTIFVTARHLPAAPKGKAYALWAHIDGKVLPAGQYQCDGGGTLRGRHTSIRDLARAEGFSLTLEAAGDVAVPSGPILLTRS